MEESVCKLFAAGCKNGGDGHTRYRYFSMNNCKFNTDCFWKEYVAEVIDAYAIDTSGNAFKTRGRHSRFGFSGLV